MVTGGERQTSRTGDSQTESSEGLLAASDGHNSPAPVASQWPSKEEQKRLESEKDKKNGTMTVQRPTKKPVSKNGAICRVKLLDGTDIEVEVDKSGLGEALVDNIAKHLSLMEKDYFSCTYHDSTNNCKVWLAHDKRIDKQIKGNRWQFTFEMKFYPTEPASLHEDLTRYFLCLQLRTDIIGSKLPCSFVTHALLGSYAVQSDVGDYDVEVHGATIDYIKDIKFVQNQSEELLEKISELHKTHRGQTPAEAEMNYLDNAKKLAMYGVHMFPAKDQEGVDINIGVCATGLVIYRDKLRINRFAWPKILKIAYKRNIFSVKNRPTDTKPKNATLAYKLSNYTMAKRLWKLAVEHHAFFRLKEAEKSENAKFAPFGSKFRYSGRTQFQSRNDDYGRDAGPTVDRGASRRKFVRDSPSNTLERGGPGTATERKEDKLYMTEGGAATLTLTNRGKRGNVPVARMEDDQNLSAVSNGHYGQDDDIDEANISLLAGGGNDYSRVSYMKNPYGTTGSAYNQSPAVYDPYGTGRNSSIGREGPYSDYPGERVSRQGPPTLEKPGGKGVLGPNGLPLRDSHGNMIIISGKNGEDLPPYEDDQQYEHSVQGGAPGQGRWGHQITTTTRTTTKTYTNPDGTVCTEHKTEKDGVIETRIERRVVVNAGDEDELDHDKALAEAIRLVTDMNPDLSVEKIEIQTKTERESQRESRLN